MQIVTDSAADLAPSQIAGLPIHFTTLRLSLGGVPFTGSNEEFYKKLSETDEYPVTSQAAAGEFAELYRKVSKLDPEILSIHISGGLSGTINSARVGASMVPEAQVTFWDSRTLSAALGWQVEAAARMVMKGFKLDKILERLTQIRDTVDGMFSIKEMKYLIHGGRVSHLKGLLASVLNIKPVIGVDHTTGMYTNAAQDMTFKRALTRMINLDKVRYAGMGALRAQIVHGNNPEGVEFIRKKAEEELHCTFEPTVPVAPALGAHTGPTLAGIIVGPQSLFADLY
ncbi:MAG: DegV family protein [Anaerolineaceae bacterium]|nr:DegV family protein [Anaerolineaceae bacterium]